MTVWLLQAAYLSVIFIVCGYYCCRYDRFNISPGRLLKLILIPFISFSWSVAALVFTGREGASRGNLHVRQVRIFKDRLIVVETHKITFTVGPVFDSDDLKLSVDATELLGENEELGDDNALVAYDHGLTSGSNSTSLHGEGQLGCAMIRDVTTVVFFVITWFIRRYQSFGSYIKVLRSDIEVQNKGRFGLHLLGAVLLLLLLLAKGDGAILTGPGLTQLCSGSEDVVNGSATSDLKVPAACSDHCQSSCDHCIATSIEIDQNSSCKENLRPLDLLTQFCSDAFDFKKCITSTHSVQKALGIFQLSPKLPINTCFRPSLESMKRVLKQFRSTTVIDILKVDMLDNSSSGSKPKASSNAEPSGSKFNSFSTCLGSVIILLIILVPLSFMAYRWCTHHVYNETGPVAELPKFMTPPSPCNGLSDAYRATVVPSITPAASYVLDDSTGNFCSNPQTPRSSEAPTPPDMCQRQCTAERHPMEMVGIRRQWSMKIQIHAEDEDSVKNANWVYQNDSMEDGLVNLASSPPATASGSMAPYECLALKGFTAIVE